MGITHVGRAIEKRDNFKKTPNTNASKFIASVKSCIQWGALCVGARIVAMYPLKLLKNKDISLGDYMPDYMAKPIEISKFFFKVCDEFVGPQYATLNSIVISPIMEEVTFRLLVQELLLKKIPRVVIGKISKDHTHLVDSKIAQYARVIFSSALFGLLHYFSPSDLSKYMEHVRTHPEMRAQVSRSLYCLYNNNMLKTFIVGLVYGSLQEKTGNVVYPILGHVLNNWVSQSRFLQVSIF